MDKELFSKTEGQLYRYFREKEGIESSKRKIALLEKQILEIESDIRSTNIKIDYYQNGIEITERVQTSSKGTSYAEQEIEKAIDKLEKEYCYKIRSSLKCKASLREKENRIRLMQDNLNMLNEEDKRFIELKYGDEKEVPYIAMKLNMAQATAYRKREELVLNVARFMNIIK